MVTAFKVSKDMNNVSLEELISALRSHEIKNMILTLFRMKRKTLKNQRQKKTNYPCSPEGSIICGSTDKRSSGTSRSQKINQNLLDTKSQTEERSSVMNAKNLVTSKVIVQSFKKKNQRRDLVRRKE